MLHKPMKNLPTSPSLTMALELVLKIWTNYFRLILQSPVSAPTMNVAQVLDLSSVKFLSKNMEAQFRLSAMKEPVLYSHFQFRSRR